MLQQLLEQAKHQVIARSSAEEALAEVEQGDLDLVLADVQLQQLPIAEVCERFRALPLDIPTIVRRSHATHIQYSGAPRTNIEASTTAIAYGTTVTSSQIR